MPILTLRLRSPEGVSTIQIDSASSILDLRNQIESISKIPSPFQELRIGFPPKLIQDSLDSTLASLNIQRGEVITVAKSSNFNESIPAGAAPKVVDNTVTSPSQDYQLSIEVEGAYLTHRIVPDDNSCLFHSIALVLEQSKVDSIAFLRSLVAKTILADPENWSEAVLGRPTIQYAQTISNSNSWGGAIELSILSNHYQLEICSIDVSTGRIDRFGEEKDYQTRVILIYSGIHYDALTLSPMKSIKSSIYPPTVEFDTTIFSKSEKILKAASALAAILKSQHYYTDATTFTLRCGVCKEAIVGEKEARSHATETGHQSFVEY